MHTTQIFTDFCDACECITNALNASNGNILKLNPSFKKFAEIAKMTPTDFANKTIPEIFIFSILFLKINITNILIDAFDRFILNNHDALHCYIWIAAYLYRSNIANEQHPNFDKKLLNDIVSCTLSSYYAEHDNMINIFVKMIIIKSTDAPYTSCPRKIYKSVIVANIEPSLQRFCLPNILTLNELFVTLVHLNQATQVCPDIFNQKFYDRVLKKILEIIADTTLNPDIQIKSLCVCFTMYCNIFLKNPQYAFGNQHACSLFLALQMHLINIINFADNDLRKIVLDAINHGFIVYFINANIGFSNHQMWNEMIHSNFTKLTNIIPDYDFIDFPQYSRIIYNIEFNAFSNEKLLYDSLAAMYLSNDTNFFLISKQQSYLPINSKLLYIFGKYFENLLGYQHDTYTDTGRQIFPASLTNNRIDLSVYNDDTIMMCFCIRMQCLKGFLFGFNFIESLKKPTMELYINAMQFSDDFNVCETSLYSFDEHIKVLIDVIDMAGYIGNMDIIKLIDYSVARMMYKNIDYALCVSKYLIKNMDHYFHDVPLIRLIAKHTLILYGKKNIFDEAIASLNPCELIKIADLIA